MRLNLRSPQTQKWVIGIGLAFAMIYGYFQFVYVPRRELGVKLAADIKTEMEMLEKGKRIAANYQTVQDDYSRLLASWDVAQQLLPSSKEMEELLKHVAMEGQQHNVDFLLFKPMEPVEQAYYWENPIQIKTLSDYHDLGRFISAVASLDRIVNITSLKLATFRPNRGRSPNTVEADFVATIYIFKDLGSPAEVTTPAADEKGGKKPKSGGAKPRKGDA